MKIRLYTLRAAIPASLLIGGLLVGGASVFFELHQSDARAEKRSEEYLTILGSLVSGDIADAFRSGRSSQVRSVIGRAMSNRHMRFIALYDEHDTVLNASKYALNGKPLAQTPLAGYESEFAEVRANSWVLTRFSEDRRRLVSLHYTILEPRIGKLVSSRGGVLAMAYDLTASKREARTDAFTRAGWIVTVLMAYCMLIAVAAHVLISRRVERLVAATRRIAAGDFTVWPGMDGPDEIAVIGRALNEMARQLDKSTAEQRLNREKLHLLNESLEERVRERTQELETSNRDLEAFSYSVAHDLRSPLRAIEGYASIILGDHQAGIDDEARDYLSRIQQNALRLGQLIDELLSLSKLGRQDINTQALSPSSVVREIQSEIAAETGNRRIDWRIDDVPSCEADPVLFKQLLVNLVSNAVKFTALRDPAEIHFGSQMQDGGTVYFLRDNGVGFDMQYADKAFKVFKRLHEDREYKGTGIGLAIVQRIVQRHNGEVWVESAPDQGTCFYFTIGWEPETKMASVSFTVSA